MALPRFQVLIPTTLSEALSLLAEQAPKGGRVLAGGTDLLVDLKRPIYQHTLNTLEAGAYESDASMLSTLSAEEWKGEKVILERDFKGALISLHKLSSLKFIKTNQGGELSIGALTTAREIQRSEIIREKWTALAEGADALGSPLVRARGTIGGNICNARPAADLLIPSLALEAKLKLESLEGSRLVPLDCFCTGPGKTVRKPAEILTEIIFPSMSGACGSAYYKLGQRKALDISVVGVAVWIKFNNHSSRVKRSNLNNTKDKIQEVRLSMGAVGPTPLLSPSAVKVLIGRNPTEEILREASEAAARDCRPIDDHRGSAEYRRQMVQTLTLRVLQTALGRAREAK